MAGHIQDRWYKTEKDEERRKNGWPPLLPTRVPARPFGHRSSFTRFPIWESARWTHSSLPTSGSG